MQVYGIVCACILNFKSWAACAICCTILFTFQKEKKETKIISSVPNETILWQHTQKKKIDSYE